MSDLEAMLSRSFVEHLVAATTASTDFIKVNPELSRKVTALRAFGEQALLEAVPSDFDSLDKIGFFPFTEASTECSYSVNLALGGAYKPAYLCLRSYLELSLVGLFFLSLPPEDRSGQRWLRGEDPTPFRSAIVRALRSNAEFAAAAEHVGFFERLNHVYGSLSDRTHTRGEQHSHQATSKANFPRFIPESLQAFISELNSVSELVALGFAILRPVVLVALPIDEKFGFNPPLSGFLQEFEVETFRSLLPPEHLDWLDARAATDEEATSIKAWVESMPDLTREQWEEQAHEFQQCLKDMGRPPDDSPQQ